MWIYILFISIVYFVPNDPTPHIKMKALGAYSTAEECETVRKNVAENMATSYPNQTDYFIGCEKKKDEKKPTEREF